GRIGRGRNLHQVHTLDLRQPEGLGKREHSELLFVLTEDADFTGTDLPVDLDLRAGKRTRSERAAQSAASLWSLFMRSENNHRQCHTAQCNPYFKWAARASPLWIS